MQVTYDKSIDAMYIYFKPKGSKSANTIPMDPAEVNGIINIDFDKNHNIMGLEVLDASKKFDEVTFNELLRAVE